MNETQQAIRWGMIGCGNVTEVKSAPAFNQIPGSQLVAVMSRTEERVRDYAARHQVPKWCVDARRLIEDPDVNAIYIATPPASHAEYTLLAAAAGKPVYVEKPMACRYAECRRMIGACERAGVPLFVAYYRRCLPRFLKIKELVDGGAIGAVRLVSINFWLPPRPGDTDPAQRPWRVRPEVAGGGYFYDLASHQLDFLDFLLGPIRQATGQAVNQAGWYSAEDVVCGHFRFESGVMGSGSWCFTVSPGALMDRTEIVGSEGLISYSTFGEAPIQLQTAKGAEEFAISNPRNIQLPLIQTIVAELQGRGQCPSTGRTAARTNRVMEALCAKRA
jgi:predicted dehydrogenase